MVIKAGSDSGFGLAVSSSQKLNELVRHILLRYAVIGPFQTGRHGIAKCTPGVAFFNAHRSCFSVLMLIGHCSVSLLNQ